MKAAAFFALALLGLVLLRRHRQAAEDAIDNRLIADAIARYGRSANGWRDFERVDSV